MKVLNITRPDVPVAVQSTKLAIADARNIYLARTYAYVAAGKQGIAIVNVEQPENPTLDQFFNAEGKLNDTNDVKIGMVSSSLFAFVADGKNGMQVFQLFSPQATPKFGGFSPQPVPKLIASYPTHGRPLAISRHRSRSCRRRNRPPVGRVWPPRLQTSESDGDAKPVSSPRTALHRDGHTRREESLNCCSNLNSLLWRRITGGRTRIRSTWLGNFHHAFNRLFLPPVMIAVAFEASSFRRLLRRASVFVAGLA